MKKQYILIDRLKIVAIEEAAVEKAKELYDKFYMSIPSDEMGLCDEASKQCALIAVDEILDTLNYDIRDLDVRGNILLDLIQYWQEVKQEIEKL